MRTRNLSSLILALLVVSVVTALASPVDLYLVKFAPGTDIYRLAGTLKWPVYHISGQQALIGKQLSKLDNIAVLESNRIYSGPSENLFWVHLKRNSPMPAIKAVYSGKDMLLVESDKVAAAGVKSGRDYMVKNFISQPMIIPSSIVVRNSNLTRDTVVAALTHLIDTAHVRATIDTFQAFNTRSIMASNHDSVAKWIQQKFLDLGIADVQIDSFTDADLNASVDSVVWMKNVVATIPGTKDVNTVYVIGGHYDSSVWPYNPWAPGADDNASGTTAALEAAMVMAANPPAATVKFVAFDGEEWGLYGCDYFASQAQAQGMNIATMLNFDMIGNLGNSNLFNCYSYDGSEVYASISGQCAQWYGLTADTNLTPVYVNDNSSGSDSWSFFTRGYPVTYSEEYLFSPQWHLTNDSTTYMNMRYCTSIIKAGMGLLGTFANYPQKVSGLTVTDVGNGAQLYLQWQPNTASNISGYKIYWGKNSGSYSDSMQITGISDTIGGLSADSLYHIGLSAINDDGKESPLISEITGIPRITPVPPAGLSVTPMIKSINIAWRSGELDLAGYRMYRKIDLGNWDSLNIPLIADTVYIDSVPSESSRYWYRLRAFDTGGNVSPFSDSIDSYTYAPLALSATPIKDGITLSWPFDSTKNIAGYVLYRKINQSTFDSLDIILGPGTSCTDSSLSGINKYYYRLQAFDGFGNLSKMSDSTYGRPITLDQGVLVIDETNNWTSGSWPRDAQQDSFYNYIFSDYKHEQYEYSGNAQKPFLADIVPYSSVVWLGDDNTYFFAYDCVDDIKSYLDAGGKLWFAGWKPTGDIRNNISYPVNFSTGSLIYDEFKISHAELSGTTDSFKTALGLKGYPSITVDTLKYPVTVYGKTMRSIEALTPLAGADTIYSIDMKNDGSLYEGRACAVRDSGKTVFFGFPLYFMDKEQVKLAAQKVMAEFGEPLTGVAGKPETGNRITEFRLSQNAPNPFAKVTTISYQLPRAGQIKLNIYNIAGQLVKTLVTGEQPAGSYTLRWDRKDNNNKQVSAGVYIYRLSTGNNTQSRKMLVLK